MRFVFNVERLEERTPLAVSLLLQSDSTASNPLVVEAGGVSDDHLLVEVVNQTGNPSNPADFMSGWQTMLTIVPTAGTTGTVGFNSVLEPSVNYVMGGISTFGVSATISTTTTPADTVLAFDFNFPFSGGVDVPAAPGANLLDIDFAVSADASGVFEIVASPTPGSEWTDSSTPTQRSQTFANLAGGSSTIGFVSVISSEIGTFRPSNKKWFLDANGNGQWDASPGDSNPRLGGDGDLPVVGDWNNDGLDDIGTFRPGNRNWYLDTNANGTWDGPAVDTLLNLGIAGDLPVTGDWNGDGIDDIGVFRPSNRNWYLDTSGNGQWDGPAVDTIRRLGIPGDVPVTGDWNNDGTDDFGVFRPINRNWYLDTNGNGQWDGSTVDSIYRLGIIGDLPVTGDWNNNGADDIGVFRPSNKKWYLDSTGNGQWDGPSADTVSRLGGNGDLPVTGRWMPPAPLRVAAGAGNAVGGSRSITIESIRPVVDEAISRWAAAGLAPHLVTALSTVNIHIADLRGDRVAQTNAGAILLDRDAAGYGWFVDDSPARDEEFYGAEFVANPGSAAHGRVDLLTVVMHEFGHVLGLGDVAESVLGNDGLMHETLSVGVRRLPSQTLADEVGPTN